MAVDAPEDLYALPPGEFVAARDQLARQMAAGGDRDGAKVVKALRKPTVAAAALNQVTRRQPDLPAALIEAHRRLRSADSADVLRAASEARMDAIRRIVDAADGVTDAVGKKMRSTLLASATDPAAEEALVAGRLDGDLEPAGLGGFATATPFAPAGGAPPAPAASAQKKPTESARTAKARLRVEKLEAEAAEAGDEARRLRKEADKAERLAATAEERAAAGQARAEEARRVLEAG